MSASLTSANVYTNNVLLHVTVPKRTGRKRKRGSAEWFDADDSKSGQLLPEGLTNGVSQDRSTSTASNVGRLSRSLLDNSQAYAVKTIGLIDQTHRFRGKPEL